MPMLCKRRTYCLLAFIGIVAFAAVGGCSSDGPRTVRVIRDADTEIIAGERMAVILTRYRQEDVEVTELEPVEATFEECIETQIRAAHGNVDFVPADDFRKLVSRDTRRSEGFKSPESLLRTLAGPGTASRLTKARLRYVLLLDASYATGPSEWWDGGSGGGAVGFIAAGKSWRQDAVMEATILDMKHARVAGSVRTRSVGSEGAGGGVGIIVIIPVAFPVYFNSMTESGNCRALGKELARFFSSKN